MKSDFVSMASHELRTPLTSILGFVKTLQQAELGDDPELRDEFLTRMERQSDRLLRLVDQLLQAARLQTEGAEPKIERFDFTYLAREVVSAVEEDGAHVVSDLPRELPQLWSDRGMVEYILTNLLGNALKYSRPGGKVTIGARNSVGNFRFWIEDEGPGIDPPALEHLFKPFWQADTSLTRSVGGVGLGLYIVKQFTLALRGDVIVESKVGVGTRFTVVLPNVRAPVSLGIKGTRRAPADADDEQADSRVPVGASR
jgi:two-component system phosphate regulon sensor histidine kinase PhoR